MVDQNSGDDKNERKADSKLTATCNITTRGYSYTSEKEKKTFYFVTTAMTPSYDMQLRYIELSTTDYSHGRTGDQQTLIYSSCGSIRNGREFAYWVLE